MLPALYLGHGAPPLLDDPIWPGQLRDWADRLPRPRAILIVSAHWEAAPLALSSPIAATPVIYDFAGFDPKFFRMTYPTPDASVLAEQVSGLFGDRHKPVVTGRGLDHGSWVPLTVMYPDADIPVLQLSVPTQDPEALLALGARLRPLREQGVLIIGSGFLTHGLPFLRREDWMGTAPPPAWSRDFDDWAAEALVRGDVAELTRYRSVAPGMPYAHPTVEHFIPLFITLGAADDPEAPPTTEIDGYFLGLSKRSLSVA
ncbi:MAG: class III extradiol ring-cleavage dioxygenase [Candidatus Nanopelagicales bacterium]